MPLTFQHRILAEPSPMLRLYARCTGASMRRVALQSFVSAVVLGLILALTGVGGHSSRPITAVRGEVEVGDSVSRLEVVVTEPPVAIIDAVCITNTPTREPC